MQARGLQTFVCAKSLPEAFDTTLKGLRCLQLPLLFLYIQNSAVTVFGGAPLFAFTMWSALLTNLYSE